MTNKSLQLGLQDLKLAARSLLRHRRRSALAVGIVAGGVIAFLLAGGFINWILVSMREATIHSQLGHVQITRPDYLSKGVADPYRYLLPEVSTQEAAIKQVKGLKTITPRLAFSGLISKDDATISFLGEGIDPVSEAPITDEISIVSGKDLTESPPDSVIVGQGLAASIGAKAGDRLVLLSTTRSGSLNAVEATVAGLFVTVSKPYDDSVLRAPIELARRLVGVSGATSWVVLLDETDETDAAVATLRRTLDPAQFEVTPWTALADFYNKTVELFSKQVGIVRLLIGMIVILSITNTLTMSVMERTNEIGTAMALGIARVGILRQFLFEGVLIGIVGGIGGSVVGWLLSVSISAVGIPMPPAPGMTEGYLGEIQLSLPLIQDSLTLAIFTTLLASLFPAWKASRMAIVDALRYQR
ncbi:ABC transporter permease [Nitrogeniibacter mangrovi]|uniref:ABC transporter permease n=1 Tax=Nitrogeniibacter mangrovi TaxID=2016596 RepID=A0A6C1B4X0_9RHOO|nr:FtsX-like permease family protein [Nitrogeniibacter mangrovi]QID18732.1 ABC transporter permease [Nitrogeniibacter mangrovi]